MAFTLSATPDSNRLLFANGDRSHVLHPMWLRERTMEDGTIDTGSLQRLFVPSDLDPDVTATTLESTGVSTVITWSDGHVQTVDHAQVAVELGWDHDPIALPTATPWSAQPGDFPRFVWPQNDADLAPVVLSLIHI